MEIRSSTRYGKVGVLMGGPSSEREISLKSGNAVYLALKDSGQNVVAIDIETDNIDKNIKLIKEHNLNCVFLALHGRFGEDGSIQNILEMLDLPYTGSGVQASRLAMDKAISQKIFKGAGLNIPDHTVLDRRSYDAKEFLAKDPAFPVVIKPASHGSSIGLSIIDRPDEFENAIELAFSVDEKVIIEEYIKGRELTVGILDESALPIIEIIPENKFFDYDSKYKSGTTQYIVPAQLEEKAAEKVRESALSAHRLLGCWGCSRVDFILDKESGQPFILEVNTIPGFTSKSLLPKAAKSAGMEFNELCIRLLELAYEKKQSRVLK